MKMEWDINPQANIPRIIPFLADAILDLNGCQTEGIFRVPGDADAVTGRIKLLFFGDAKSIIDRTPFQIYGVE